MTIHPDSRSYPFLALARLHDVEYGIVLAAADAVRKFRGGRHGDLDHWETRAVNWIMDNGSRELSIDIGRAVNRMTLEKGETG